MFGHKALGVVVVAVGEAVRQAAVALVFGFVREGHSIIF
jgi:hypothetical protein